MADLFPDAPRFTPPSKPLSGDDLRLLATLPRYDTVREIEAFEIAACRRLERLGLVKVNREKDDDLAERRTLYAGRIDPPSPTETQT